MISSVSTVTNTLTPKSKVIARVSRVYQQNREIETLPELHLDNYFIVWGLRYRKYGDRRKNGWRLWYQRIALIYQILISLKWILVSIVSFYTQDEHILMVLGDFTAYLGGTREYYHFLITFATLYPTVIQNITFDYYKLIIIRIKGLHDILLRFAR